MARLHLTEGFARTEDALSVLLCLTDDSYAAINPQAKCYESIKRLSDSEVITLALLQQLRDAQRFFWHLFPGSHRSSHPSSFHRRLRRLRRLEWSRCGVWSWRSWWVRLRP